MLARRSLTALAAVGAGAASLLFGTCGPFTDVAADSFCPFVLEIFTLGITTGTTATTYDPTSSVSRLQMATFLSRSVDGVLKRGSRRSVLGQPWTARPESGLGLVTVGLGPNYLQSDGQDVWVSNFSSSTISRVRVSDGKLLETWTGAYGGQGVLVAMWRVFAAGYTNPGSLFRIDPSQPAGAVTTVASTLGGLPFGVAFDGARIWTANSTGSVSIVTPTASIPWTVTTVTTGFNAPWGILFDGSRIWVADHNAGTLLKLDSTGAILQTVTVGEFTTFPVFDGTNIWAPVPVFPLGVAVVRASTGTVLQTLTGNGLNGPSVAAFDGQRVLVTNFDGDSVSLWKAADLSPIGSFSTGAGTRPLGACSDGRGFWVALDFSNQIGQF